MICGDGNSIQSIAMVFAGATLLPFLQALWGAAGTRVGERLDDATRGALRRVLRRELEESPLGDSADCRHLTSPGGTRIRIDADMPEQALSQLLTLAFEPLEEDGPDVPALVRWTSGGWLATVARSGQLHDLNWDTGRSCWVDASATPTA
ncbi:hypothetical protein [Streptomyces anulatus]|uniref:hypothetical protein n=1 Tax=Streptomyces anulatus TaxID=1892 RepID=UPI00386635AB|nr:hypothetical protein OHA54_00095 [Streptomyces anulatus]WTD14814.1 hypothetical protein OHA54_38695 [Streptomyces anulatus]WTE01011.1 hypothetical protein OH765_00095 [Streptomyces anulatus]WTE08124.1 hypothetical protein OH765_38800 [Streptomyces anulatus]